MPAPSYYGPGSSVAGGESGRRNEHGEHVQLQDPKVGWTDDHRHPPQQQPNQNQQYGSPPMSPPPSYAGHGYENQSQAHLPPQQSYQGGPPLNYQQQQPQEPLQVYAHHPASSNANIHGVYEQHGGQGGGGGYYAPSPSPGPRKDGSRRDHKHGHGHGDANAGGRDGKGGKHYPRPGGEVEVVYVERERRKSRKDDVAVGFCAGCLGACCCCGCSVM